MYYLNGNMVTDGLNNRTFSYNHLNLISTVQNASSSASYRWLADGTKASVTDNDGYGFEYLGSFVYQRAGGSVALESISFGAGRFIANSTGSVTPNYYITDHLGSVRVVFTSPTNIVAQNDYYAFGLKHSNPNLANSSSNRHLFNGKEWQSTGSVGLLDYGARTYDAKIIRWTEPDPLAEQFLPISPYVFSGNNPVKFIDRDGRWFGHFMEDDWYEDKDGNYIYTTQYRSQEDLNNAGIQGNYLGLNPTINEKYLSLLGAQIPLVKSNGNTNYIAAMVYNLDETIKNYYKPDVIINRLGIYEERNYYQDMSIPGMRVSTIPVVFNYAGGTVRYYNVENMTGGVLDWGRGAYERLGGFVGSSIYGVHIKVTRATANFDVLFWTFPNKEAYNKVRQQVYKLLKGRDGYTK